MAVNPDKNIVEQSLIARLIGKIKRIALDISDDVSAEETRAMAAEAAAKTVVAAGENCSVTKATASDGHDVYTINADGKPQVQADWNQADSSKVDYIKNKPDLSLKEDVANKATTVRQSGSADDTHFPSEAAVRSAIDSAVSAAYKAAGTKRAAELTSSLLVAANEGNVYNITEAGTTDNNFVDGAGKTINVGDNVGVCKVGNDYKFDLLSGFVDLSDYVQKSNTAGLLKNDGTVDTSDYLTKTGDGSNVTITPDGSTGTTFSSGGKLSALTQKFMNLVSSLKALAFKDKVSDSDIDGVISASHIPDSIKDKIVFIEASFNSATQVFTCNDASYNDITGYLQSGKVPVVRVSVYANASATTPVRIHDLYYHGYDSQVESPNTGKYKFGSTDGYEDGSRAYVTSVKCSDSTGWGDYQDYAVPSLTKMNTDLAGKASATPTFSEASARNNLNGSNESMTTILGKIKKWFTDLKALAFKDTASYNDLSSGVKSSLDKADSALQSSDVDQSYTPLSTNPQSGTAVAQAVANKANTDGSYNSMSVGKVYSIGDSAGTQYFAFVDSRTAGYKDLRTIPNLSGWFDTGNGTILTIGASGGAKTTERSGHIRLGNGAYIGFIYSRKLTASRTLELPDAGGFLVAAALSGVGSATRPVYAKPDGSLAACNFNAAAYHIFNDGVVDNIPDYIFKEYNQFIIKDSTLRIYAEQLVENICYNFYNYKGNYCRLSFSKRTNATYTRVWNSNTATLSTDSWTDWPSLSRNTVGICIVVRIGGTIYVSGY